MEYLEFKEKCEKMSVEELTQLAEKQLKIDIYNLHFECRDQPILQKFWAELANEASYIVKNKEVEIEEIENEIKILKAKLSHKVEQDPDEYELERKTDTTVKLMVRQQKELIELQGQYFKAKKKLNNLYRRYFSLRNTVTSFSQRKDLLENENKLWLNNYYSNIEIDRPVEDSQGVTGKRLRENLKGSVKQN